MFIVFDGLDGSGKSTQAKLFCSYLDGLGMSFILRTHPSNDNIFGSVCRRCLLMDNNLSRISASLFYLLDVFRSVIMYYWRPVDYVVFVRYLMGTAYLPETLFKIGYLFFLKIVPSSPRMLFINTTPNEAHQRIENSRAQKEVFESLERLQKVYRKMIIIASRSEWINIDGDRSIEEIHREIKSLLAL
jgi:dTMP kinase